jgi:arylsulfatase
VFPLVDDLQLFVSSRPPSEDEFERPVRIRPGTPTLDRYRSGKLVQYRSFTITAAVELQTGDQGVLVSHGSQGGGYMLYVEDGMLAFAHRAFGKDTLLRGGPLPSDACELVAVVNARAGGVWSVELSVDGATLAGIDDLPTFQAFLAPLEGIDVGIARRSPVSWSLHERRGAFPWTGELHYIEYKLGPLVSDAPSLIAQQQIKARWE